MKKALYWRRLDKSEFVCELCPNRCVMGEGEVGLCRVRGVKDGVFMALGYGHVTSLAVDPIEKKPLYHFRPDSNIFSVGGWGCNLSCRFCQNWEISQCFMDDSRSISAEQLVQLAVDSRTGAVAYTYNEPLVGYEFVYDCAKLAKEQGLVNVLVTNGYIMPEPAAMILHHIDALNIDIKSMDNRFYSDYCCGTVKPVLDFAKQAMRAKCHVEITNLIIPGCNDCDRDILTLSEWIADNLGRETVLHLSAYFPRHKFDIKATPYGVLDHARILAAEKLDNVYLGNVY